MSCLPAELVDEIIDHLHENRPALAACGLTCRAWVPRSRHYLFNKIDIGTHSTSCDLIAALFLASPSLASHVRELVIHGRARVTGPDQALPASAFCTVLGAVQNLRYLRLSAVRWSVLGDDARTAIVERCRTVSILDLHIVRFQPIEEFARVLEACTALRRLNMSHIALGLRDGPAEPAAIMLPPSLTHLLTLNISPQFRLLPSKVEQRVEARVSWKEYRANGDLLRLNSFLRDLGDNLTILILTFRVEDSVFLAEGLRTSLAQNTRLEALRLDNIDLQLPRVIDPLGWIVETIASTTSDSMRHITLGVLVAQVADIPESRLRAIAQVLEHAKFSQIRRVVIRYTFPGRFSHRRDDAAAERALRSCLSSLDIRGVLHLVSSGTDVEDEDI